MGKFFIYISWFKKVCLIFRSMKTRVLTCAFFPFALVLSACGGSHANSTLPIVVRASSNPMPPGAILTPGVPVIAANGISFSSDQSFILQPGTSARIAALGPNGAAVTWTSSNPSVASVDSSGNIQALTKGVSIITSSAGGVTDYGAVLVGETGPNVVVVSSSDVLANTGEAATLNVSAAKSIGIGTIVVSGDQGGLLAKVTAITTSGLQSVLSLSPCNACGCLPECVGTV